LGVGGRAVGGGGGPIGRNFARIPRDVRMRGDKRRRAAPDRFSEAPTVGRSDRLAVVKFELENGNSGEC
jgi:hypothetical protein